MSDLSVDLKATPPSDKFDELKELIPAVEDYWTSPGHLKKLAVHAQDLGWPPQETINLLVAYRRKHGEDFIQELDYYGSLLEQTESPDEEEESPDPLGELTDRLGVPFNRILKFTGGSEIEYVIELEDGSRHELGGVRNIDSQKRFRQKMMNQTGHVIAKEDGSEYSETEWMQILQLFMDAVEETSTAGDYGRPKSERLLKWLQGFFAKFDIPRLMTEDEKKDRITRQVPYRTKNKLCFSSERFVKYLKRVHNETFSTTSIAQDYYTPRYGERKTRLL
jgi:hypothetical protein